MNTCRVFVSLVSSAETLCGGKPAHYQTGRQSNMHSHIMSIVCYYVNVLGRNNPEENVLSFLNDRNESRTSSVAACRLVYDPLKDDVKQEQALTAAFAWQLFSPLSETLPNIWLYVMDLPAQSMAHIEILITQRTYQMPIICHFVPIFMFILCLSSFPSPSKGQADKSIFSFPCYIEEIWKEEAYSAQWFFYTGSDSHQSTANRCRFAYVLLFFVFFLCVPNKRTTESGLIADLKRSVIWKQAEGSQPVPKSRLWFRSGVCHLWAQQTQRHLLQEPRWL